MTKKIVKKNNRYTPQFRRKVVLEIEEDNKTYMEVVREYGLNEATLSRWLKEYRTGGLKKLNSIYKGGRRKDKVYKTKSQLNLEKKKILSQEEEMRLLRMENEYYKRLLKLMEEDSKKKPPTNKKPK